MNTAAAREGAASFDMASRGTIVVTGEDRTRWLDGMVSNDVASLLPDPARSGCYAALLTPQGRIVADLHVLHRGEAYWLDLARSAVPDVLARLERYVIADDVALRDASDELDRLGVEGARARDVLEAAAGRALTVAPDGVEDVVLGEVAVAVGAFGFGGGPGFQLFAPAGSGPAVSRALRAAAPLELVEGSAALLETLRVESGIPALGSELAEDTLPDEAGIGRAISERKGCYTGQEVIARLRSRGGVKHRLVGLRGEGLPAPGARLLRADGKRTGELTSRARSELAGGEIALGFVHRDDAAPGTRLACDGRELVVCALPFVPPAAPSGGDAPSA